MKRWRLMYTAINDADEELIKWTRKYCIDCGITTTELLRILLRKERKKTGDANA